MQLEMGQILKAVWGYDQTNVDYYQVTAKNGATMNTIRPIRSKEVPNNDQSMTGKTSPFPNDFTGPDRRVKPDKNGYVKLTSYSYAKPCQPNDVSRYSFYG
jgi:hypothetical protein